MDAFQKALEEESEDILLRENVIASRPAQSKVIIAGGVVFKGLTCLAVEGINTAQVMERMETGVEGFRIVNQPKIEESQSITPLNIYSYTYKKKVIGISRVVFFEYATQMSFAGIYRDQDRNLVEELVSDLSHMSAYMTVPSPLRTDERDARVETNMFLIRMPLKEELQSDFVNALIKVPGLAFFSA
ncbi:MAG: hypothetical protein A2V52_06270 [Actinobacteria bacterium RBG_19FT_COMBO_54_7]|uniref:Uncharacterized protein n=1 Tax=Candidatus Solincola sediminis TaxID=1797199 RepID=A0A1F2WSJ1_9ACTN|nr:MAG: hypothetical protein A2Y75_05015 [Candidatus Solincola sediminis]OFW61596.1 MAG: hypothetical protein A2W01_07935 [Candidatus Solincola sediminis]OFW70442.1 MAG: hypothetical protein A2V52_06270 [Actinobacteria bacterium RBG_19FT_COMBO_54_7]